MSWKNDDIAVPNDGDERPAIGVSELKSGDSMTLNFEHEGEKFHSDKYGEGVRFDVAFAESDVPISRDGTDLAEGDRVTLVTWSSPLLGELASLDALTGNQVKITREGTGYQSDYTVEVVS